MENQSVKGYIFSRNETKELLSQPIGIRIKEIRLKLDAIYPGEFNLKKVAQDVIYSESGLTKLEKGNTNPHDETIETFTKYYGLFNVPSGIFDKNPVSSMKPFYLGKQEDMLPYFDRSYEVRGQMHFLDDRKLPEIEDADFRYSDNAIDTSQDDVLEDEDGGYILT